MGNKSSLSNWAIIPAAGCGKRMQSKLPKQYLQLAGKTILEHTLSIFDKHALVDGIVVSISQGDPYWLEIKENIQRFSDKPILVANGGKERKDSVLYALECLYQHIKQDSWVLVHDAARPCLLESDINKLIQAFSDNEVGGLLGLPISDTLKRSNSSHYVEKTINRENMWRALTPQFFKLLTLIKAIKSAKSQEITDESSAIELLGLKPRLIEGDFNNIKITHPIDLLQAENFLKAH
jgi:2-C-methyl-D-erythritol 4-phosphate cytidylyltransferase